MTKAQNNYVIIELDMKSLIDQKIQQEISYFT